jgi:hypothetical protein
VLNPETDRSRPPTTRCWWSGPSVGHCCIFEVAATLAERPVVFPRVVEAPTSVPVRALEPTPSPPRLEPRNRS